MDARKPRRVVLIMTDTQRKDMVGCYGNPAMRTPQLDHLAKKGIRFERVYCCQPVCGPARSAIFTGTFPHSNGGWANVLPLGSTAKTIGQRIKDTGIHTAYIGKWHIDGGDYFGMGRAPDGWDPQYWYDMRNYLEELDEVERYRSRLPTTSLDPTFTEDQTFGHRCSNRAIKFLEEYGAGDFFLVVSYDEPHGPNLAPQIYGEMFRDFVFPTKKNLTDTLENKPEHQRIWAGKKLQGSREKVEVRNPLYFGCNSFVDYEIGRVLEAIDRYAPDALVIYTSDHGDALEAHRLSGKGPAMYEEITNIPFIIRWPGVAPTGKVSRSLISHVDIVPSILEVFGISPSKVLEGRSLISLFKNPDASINDHVFIEWGRYEIDHDGFGGWQPIRCVVGEGHKLVINLLTSDELYNLEKDTEEMDNLIESASSVAIRDQLHNRLLQWMNDTRDPFRGYYWERRPWRKDARPATWSYTGITRQREEDERYESRQLDYNTGNPMEDATRKK